ncbi:MAG TPA: TonB-dependent receptor [Pyrinomonadaceae bacterium]|nr:TonB-dependent receptor [Pyrinomonadaceae bacterium]
MNALRFGNAGKRAAGLLIILLLAGTLGLAQVTTGSLQGIVRDPAGAAVAGATVRVTNSDTGVTRETTTNGEGLYRVTNLQPGQNYRVEVSATGFTAVAVEKVPVLLATENSADVAFTQVAGANESIVVTGETPLIQSTQSQLAQQYTPRQLTQLPFNGGLIDNLALLTPGVTTPGDAAFSNGVGISANGNRGRSNNFQIDGQDNNDNSVAGPSLFITNTEAIGEYQVITNNYSAEFGRNAGAQINTITKPGTNAFHGAAFEYLQSSRLNASSNIDKVAQANFRFLAGNGFPQFAGLARRRNDPFTANRFGGALGGPVRKNKAFFFVTYQGDRQHGEQQTNDLTQDLVTFTPESAATAARLGFPGGRLILTNTAVGGGPAFAQGQGTFLIAPPLLSTNGSGVATQFAFGPNNAFGNPVTANRFSPSVVVRDPATGSLVTLFTGEAVRVAPNNSTEDQLITREDFNLTERDVVTARYIFDRQFFPNTPATGRFLAGAFFDVPSRTNNLGVTYTRTISPRYVNEARFNFSRLNVKFGDPQGPLPGPGITFSGQRDLVFNASLSFGTQSTLPQSRVVDVYQEQDTVTATLGNHALKLGGDLRQQKVNNFFLPNFLGVFTFRGGGATAGTRPANTFFDLDGTPLTGAPTAFENLLLGRPQRISFALGNPNIKTTQDDYFFFVQDDWRVRPNLTLNLGLRYELSTSPFNPIIDRLNARESSASTAIFNTAFDLSTRTERHLPLDKNNFAPRVGFAWQPNLHFLGDRFRDGRTVVRGGFGVAYDPSFFNIVLNTVTAAPFAAAGLVNQIPGPTALQFPSLPATTAQLNLTPGTNNGDPRLFNQTLVDPNFYNPYTLQYNFGVQQELRKKTVLEVRYVGSRIVGQFQTLNANPDIHFLERAAQCLGLDPGAFTRGTVVGTPAASAAAACAGSGFNTAPLDVNFQTGATAARLNSNGRLNPLFGAARIRTNGATATYNGLQVRFDTRLRNDLVLNANYTFSKTIDNASEIFSTLGGGQSVADPQNPFDGSRGERGLSAFDQRHVFTANFIFDVPYFRDQRGFAGKLLGGYQVSGVVRLGSGRPYTPIEAFGTYDPNFENSFIGVGALRPFIGNPNAPEGTIAFGVTAACGVLFGGTICNDPAAVPGNFILYNTLSPGSAGTVVTAAQVRQQARLIYNDFGLNNQFGIPLNQLEAFQLFKTPYGDVGRNTFHGLPFYGVNLALFKTTNITESKKLEFRVEAANLLNRRNFGVPDPITEDAATAFAVSSFQNPGFNLGQTRNLRFGLRLIF